MTQGVDKIWPWRPAMTLMFDFQNLISTSVGASEYSLSVLSKSFKPFMRYRGNNNRPDVLNVFTDAVGWVKVYEKQLPTLRALQNSQTFPQLCGTPTQAALPVHCKCQCIPSYLWGGSIIAPSAEATKPGPLRNPMQTTLVSIYLSF